MKKFMLIKIGRHSNNEVGSVIDLNVNFYQFCGKWYYDTLDEVDKLAV